jgi:hypothetical protein
MMYCKLNDPGVCRYPDNIALWMIEKARRHEDPGALITAVLILGIAIHLPQTTL